MFAQVVARSAATKQSESENEYSSSKREESQMTNKDYFVHQSSYIDENVQIGAGTKIWHFSHIMSGAKIGEYCNIGQNVVISQSHQATA